MGAAIAAGNHEEKGIWALLVIAAVINSKLSSVRDVGLLYTEGLSVKEDNIRGIDTIISASPIRLVRTVMYPAAKDLGEG